MTAVDGRFRENLVELNRYVDRPESRVAFKDLSRIQRLAVDLETYQSIELSVEQAHDVWRTAVYPPALQNCSNQVVKG